jgi:hypothetical protein
MFGVALLSILVIIRLGSRSGGPERSGGEPLGDDPLLVVSWNVAAVNNNPFEYWITHDDPHYNKMMADFEYLVENPGDNDILVNKVFTQEMFEELDNEMARLGWTGLDAVASEWSNNYSVRKIVSGFMKDPVLGKKRLISMPDRVTNTITTEDGSVYRPTVINCYQGDMPSRAAWWEQWRAFIFHKSVQTGKGPRDVHALLKPISRAKYPALSAEEEAISVPLQLLAQAIFDAVMLHLVNVVAEREWALLRGGMCASLNLKKSERITNILATRYSGADVILLQEVAAQFVADLLLHPQLARDFAIHAPLGGGRDQLSIVLLRKTKFETAATTDVRYRTRIRLRSRCADKTHTMSPR